MKFFRDILCQCGDVRSSSNGKSFSKEFLITAHFDTYRQDNPDASDNASGVGVLLELARHFKDFEDELDCIVKFIAFGAEEIGIIGSRNYLYNNSESLRQCELLFNIDDVAGNRSFLVEITRGEITAHVVLNAIKRISASY